MSTRCGQIIAVDPTTHWEN